MGYMDGGDQTQVDRVQGKRPPRYTIAPVPGGLLLRLRLFSSCPCLWHLQAQNILDQREHMRHYSGGLVNCKGLKELSALWDSGFCSGTPTLDSGVEHSGAPCLE